MFVRLNLGVGRGSECGSECTYYLAVPLTLRARVGESWNTLAAMMGNRAASLSRDSHSNPKAQEAIASMV